jgi:hypothetical protein
MQSNVSQLDTVLAALKELECADLFVVVKAATLALEKATKTTTKAAPKAGSAPKGVQPPQLAKPRAWVEFTLKHALANGWEEFTATKGSEEIVFPASEEVNGAHIYPGSVDEKFPAGKQILLTQAMSLSKQRWSVKAGKGTHEDLYKEFCAEFDDSQPSTPVSTASSASSSPKAVVRKTAAEKAAEQEAAKAAKDAEKAAAKAVKEAEKAAAKAAKDAEKAEAKRVKDLEKEAAKQAKEAAKPAKSPKAVVVKAAVVKAAVVKAAAKPVVAAKKPVEWSCPADGGVHPWESNGIKYLRNSDNQVWLDGGDEVGEWQGVYDVATGKIYDSVEEPSFDDE